MLRRPCQLLQRLLPHSLEKTYHKFQGAIPIFDSGIGSYSVVRAMQQHMPHVPLVYLADRASFPYGIMSPEALTSNIQSRVEWLSQTFSPTAIILASNTPSMTIFEDLRSEFPLVGIFPPLESAAKHSYTGHIGILGNLNLLRSTALKIDIKRAQLMHDITLVPADAATLIADVENFLFIQDPETCKAHVHGLLETLFKKDPKIDTLIFSSSHLSFLQPIIFELYPQIKCIDPADAVAKQVAFRLTDRTPFPLENIPAPLLVLTTENPKKNHYAHDFKKGLQALGCTAKVHTITL